MHVYKSIIFCCCFSGSFHSPSRLPDLFVPAASSNSSDASKITSLTGKITTEVKWRWKGEEQTLTLRRATLSLHFIWSFMIWYHICFVFSFFLNCVIQAFFRASFMCVTNNMNQQTNSWQVIMVKLISYI